MAKPLYIGIFLTEASKKKLLDRFPSIFKKIHADHITLEFKPEDDTVEKFLSLAGTEAQIRVIGYALDSKAEAVMVDVPSEAEKFSHNVYPHITLSCDEGTAPVYSNELMMIARPEGREVYLLSKNIMRFETMEPFTLLGTYDFFPRTAKG